MNTVKKDLSSIVLFATKYVIKCIRLKDKYYVFLPDRFPVDQVISVIELICLHPFGATTVTKCCEAIDHIKSS
jgi:hypothetical protein